MIVGNVVGIKVINIILNVKIVVINFVLIVLKKSIIFLIILALYVVNNFQEEMEFSKVVEKVKIIFFVGNVTSIKITNIILNAIIVEVNIVLNVLKIIIMFLIILVLYVEKNSPEDTEFSEVVGKIKIIFFA